MHATKLDLLVAHDFREWPLVWNRLLAEGIRVEEVDRSQEEHRKLRALHLKAATLEHFERLFGDSYTREGRELRWSLSHWPDHDFVGFQVDSGFVFEGGLRLRTTPSLSPSSAPRAYPVNSATGSSHGSRDGGRVWPARTRARERMVSRGVVL